MFLIWVDYKNSAFPHCLCPANLPPASHYTFLFLGGRAREVGYNPSKSPLTDVNPSLCFSKNLKLKLEWLQSQNFSFLPLTLGVSWQVLWLSTEDLVPVGTQIQDNA